MQYPYTSILPNGIDDRTFICDVDLNGKPTMDAYNNLITNGKFTDANIFISQQNVHNYSADLLNFIEAKIEAWQECIYKKEKFNPFHHSTTEPENIQNGEFWI